MNTRNTAILHVTYTISTSGFVDDHHGKFLEIWMDYHGFRELPDLIEYYTTVGNGTLLKEEYTTLEIIHYLIILSMQCTLPN